MCSRVPPSRDRFDPFCPCISFLNGFFCSFTYFDCLFVVDLGTGFSCAALVYSSSPFIVSLTSLHVFLRQVFYGLKSTDPKRHSFFFCPTTFLGMIPHFFFNALNVVPRFPLGETTYPFLLCPSLSPNGVHHYLQFYYSFFFLSPRLRSTSTPETGMRCP